MELVHVKMEKKTKEKLDHLVKRRVYKNKSEAVRSMVEEHLMEHPELLAGKEVEEFSKNAEAVSEMEFRKRLAEGLKGTKKSVAQMLAEERDRFA